MKRGKLWICGLLGHKPVQVHGSIDWQYYDRFGGTGAWHYKQENLDYKICSRCDMVVDSPPLPPLSLFTKVTDAAA